MIGNFVGSILGAFIYDKVYNVALSFCIDTGFTMFGLVEQNYKLPEYILKEMDFKVFEYEKFKFQKFQPPKFEFEKFEYEKFKYESFKITILRRGVIGISKIGYI